MPKLTPFDVVISHETKVLKAVPMVPLTKHSGGRGPNWTIGRDHSPGGGHTLKFGSKKDVEKYFSRKYPEDKGYSVELK